MNGLTGQQRQTRLHRFKRRKNIPDQRPARRNGNAPEMICNPVGTHQVPLEVALQSGMIEIRQCLGTAPQYLAYLMDQRIAFRGGIGITLALQLAQHPDQTGLARRVLNLQQCLAPLGAHNLRAWQIRRTGRDMLERLHLHIHQPRFTPPPHNLEHIACARSRAGKEIQIIFTVQPL